eukprot:Sdes_comp22916_c0_seq1m21287
MLHSDICMDSLMSFKNIPLAEKKDACEENDSLLASQTVDFLFDDIGFDFSDEFVDSSNEAEVVSEPFDDAFSEEDRVDKDWDVKNIQVLATPEEIIAELQKEKEFLVYLRDSFQEQLKKLKVEEVVLKNIRDLKRSGPNDRQSLYTSPSPAKMPELPRLNLHVGRDLKESFSCAAGTLKAAHHFKRNIHHNHEQEEEEEEEEEEVVEDNDEELSYDEDAEDFEDDESHDAIIAILKKYKSG